MIQEISISDLDPRQIKQLEGADRALSKDVHYSLEIYSSILKQSPGCLELRKRLRQQQLKIAKSNTKGISSLLGKITNAPFLFKSRSNQNPEAVIASAEELIAKNPLNAAAHQMLADACSSLEMFGTVVFAFETIRLIEPKNLQNLKIGRAHV